MRMEAWWNDPRFEQGVAEAIWQKPDERLTRLAFSWKALQLTGLVGADPALVASLQHHLATRQRPSAGRMTSQ